MGQAQAFQAKYYTTNLKEQQQEFEKPIRVFKCIKVLRYSNLKKEARVISVSTKHCIQVVNTKVFNTTAVEAFIRTSSQFFSQ